MHTDTLRFHLDRPLTKAQPVGDLPLSEAVKFVNSALSDLGSNKKPEDDAIMFYLMNHAMAEVRKRRGLDDPLGKYSQIVERYYAGCTEPCQRLFAYLLIICTRETRHAGANIQTSLKSKHGAAIATFWKGIRGTGSSGAINALRHNPPDCTLGQFTEALVFLFYKGSYGGGYGGPAWGKVADCLNGYVSGTTSPEVMLDTGWTLAHNNGPIFNKGMLYGMYSSDLKMILDVQRAGMVPQLVAEAADGGGSYTKHVKNGHKKFWNMAEKLIGSDYDGFVDWYLVEELGAVGKYSNFKTQQEDKHGLSSKFKQLKAEAAVKLEAKIAADKAAKREEKKKWFFVTPHVKVKKVKIVRPEDN